MSALELGPLLGLLALGAVHGVNPAMGWLFAVALGMQEKDGRAVWRALPPLALGHAISIAVVVMVAALIGRVVPANIMKLAVAGVLLVFGIDRLVRGHRHLRYGGMRVNRRQLTIWSFLMATAHGAGLMVLPLVLGDGGGVAESAALPHSGHSGHAMHAGVAAGQTAAITAAFVHAIGYFAVTALIASVVYHRVGLRLLRSAWINLDILWAAALILTAIITPLV
jgi:hypothetical protein